MLFCQAFDRLNIAMEFDDAVVFASRPLGEKICLGWRSAKIFESPFIPKYEQQMTK